MGPNLALKPELARETQGNQPSSLTLEVYPGGCLIQPTRQLSNVMKSWINPGGMQRDHRLRLYF